MNIHKKLQNYRKQNGLSQDQVAEKINVSRQTLSKWENDKCLPDLHSLFLLSKLYNVSLDDFFSDASQQNTTKNNVAITFSDLICIILAIVSLIIPLGFLLAIGVLYYSKKSLLTQYTKIRRICIITILLKLIMLLVNILKIPYI